MKRRLALKVTAALWMSTAGLNIPALAQIRGGGGTSTDRVVSPAVVASWRTHENYADGSSTTLLVLWRGSVGWYAGSGHSGSGGGSSGGGGGWSQSFSYGGRTFTMEFDDDKKIVKMVNQEISLKDANVILVDFVDSAVGPTMVGYRWVEPGPPAPPAVDGAMADPIAGIIQRSPELYEYLRCDLPVKDLVMKVFMPIICGQMRGERVTLPGGPPR